MDLEVEVEFIHQSAHITKVQGGYCFLCSGSAARSTPAVQRRKTEPDYPPILKKQTNYQTGAIAIRDVNRCEQHVETT